MASDPLESFRCQWKHELLSKKRVKGSQDEKPNINADNFSKTVSDNRAQTIPGPSKSNEPKQTFGTAGQPCHARGNQSNCDCAVNPNSAYDSQYVQPLFTLPVVDEEHSVYESPLYKPFSIVGQLLKEQSCSEHRKAKNTAVFNKRKLLNEHGSKKIIERTILSKRKKLDASCLKDIFAKKSESNEENERLLDKLIEDIDEITEIPFFDINLPRELAVKIFQHLDIKDLCHCAQVSKSWGSLAEDELLWCKICHLGCEKIYTTREKANWKQIVRHNVERRRTLITNWKSRTGKLSSLEHVKGKILTSVHSFGDTVVAGYTNGEVKQWDLVSGESCVLQPSSTSLVLQDTVEGVQENMVQSVLTAGTTTVAAYTQGNVDIWNTETGTQPIQKYSLPAGNQSVPQICLSSSGNMLVTCYQRCVDILHRVNGEPEFTKIHQKEAKGEIRHIKLCEREGVDVPSVIFSQQHSVHLHTVSTSQLPESHMHGGDDTGQSTEIHNMFGAPVDLIDYRGDQSLLGVALGPEAWGGLDAGLKVYVYDVSSCRPVQTLEGHCWKICCMNLANSPVNELVTASLDKQVRLFDLRMKQCVQSFTHTLPVYQVQTDGWKLVAGGEDGFVIVWDRRTGAKLWELHNRHPVRYLHFEDKTLVVANISHTKVPDYDEFETAVHRRYRGSINVYNFLEDLSTKDIPEICLSTYDQPDASNYNIALAMPYDTLTF